MLFMFKFISFYASYCIRYYAQTNNGNTKLPKNSNNRSREIKEKLLTKNRNENNSFNAGYTLCE